MAGHRLRPFMMRRVVALFLAISILFGFGDNLMTSVWAAEKNSFCAVTSGCTLANGHEGDCAVSPEKNTEGTPNRSNESGETCKLTEDCTLTAGDEGECVTTPATEEKDPASTACTVTEGCTLTAGHEGECVAEEKKEPCTASGDCVLENGHEGECITARQAEKIKAIQEKIDNLPTAQQAKEMDRRRFDALCRQMAEIEGEIDRLTDSEKKLLNTEGYSQLAQYILEKLSRQMSTSAITALSREILARNTVDDVAIHPGTKINLFDYWLWDDAGKRFEKDYEVTLDNLQQGINGTIPGVGEAQLKFIPGFDNQHPQYSQMQKYEIAANIWTGGFAPRQGLVENTLNSAGYPDTRVASDTGFTEKQSLGYLFDPEIAMNGKESYTNISGLLTIDSDGYYGYDSRKNFAEFVEKDNKFVLYNSPAVRNAAGSPVKHNGQFFPFNRARYVFSGENPAGPGKGLEVADNGRYTCLRNETPYISHYFGLTMTTRFLQSDGGLNNGKEVTYSFSGDDDVWVFIDDVLVADLGGIHRASSLNINFATGLVQINGGSGSGIAGAQEYYIYDKYAAAGKDGDTAWNGKTYADGTYHTLRFFYLERGNRASNLSLKFNLQEVQESYINKRDQSGNPVQGAQFSLYAATCTPGIDETVPLSGRDLTYSNHEFRIDTTKGTAGLLAQGVTDIDGKCVFNHMEGERKNLPWSVDELSEISDYFILRETTAPEGYRSVNKDTRLRIVSLPSTGEKLILSCDTWTTGSHTAAILTATAGTDLYIVNGNKPIPFETVVNGTLFPVYLVYQGDIHGSGRANPENWLPAYGNLMDGWYVMDEFTTQSAIQAAQANNQRFTHQKSGSFSITMDNIPGVVQEYTYVYPAPGQPGHEQYKDMYDQTKYSIVYFFSEEQDWSKMNGNNTYRVDASDFHRTFSGLMDISNVFNTLYVQKQDENGNPKAGAIFDLYRYDLADGSVTAGTSGLTVTADSVTIQPGTQPYDWATTGNLITPVNLEGGAIFPSGVSNYADNSQVKGTEKLKTDIYYLVEREAPYGYIKNDYAAKGIRVVVHNSGVYVDAGKADDGVQVSKEVGNVLSTVRAFAVIDHIDETLANIKVSLNTSDTLSVNELGGDYHTAVGNWQTDPNQSDVHFIFDETIADPARAYRAIDGGQEKFYTDVGYSTMKIRQCRDGHSGSDGQVQNLRDAELNPLFASITTVYVQNTSMEKGNLEIIKTVTGGQGDTDKEFNFTVTLSDTKVNGKKGDVTFTDGAGTFKLKSGRHVNITGIYAGTDYEVTETEANADGYTTSVISSNATGTIAANDTVTVEFVNSKGDADKGALTVRKTVEGSDGEKNRDFRFTVTFDDRRINGNIAGIDFIDGIGTFTLKDGQHIVIPDIALGTGYEVVENDANTDRYVTTVNGTAKGTIGTDSQVEVEFVNTRNMLPSADGITGEVNPPKTGNDFNLPVMLGLFAASGAGIIALIIFLRRKKQK